jgi:phage recombination protein Bet
MSNALVKYETEQGAVELSPDIVKKYLVSGNGAVSDQEVQLFLNLCKYQKLNPFLREAYLIKFGTSPATIVTGKEVFTKRASKLKDCKGWQAGVTVVKSGELERREGSLVLKGEELLGGWCKVFREGWEVPMMSEVSLSEYMKTKDGKPTAQWAQMPAVMIRKVAIVTALRDTFPEDFQGLYDSCEMPVDSTKLDDKTVVIDAIPIETKEDDVITVNQAKRIFAMSGGNTELVRTVCEKYGYTSSKDIKKADYEKICSDIEIEKKATEITGVEEAERLPWDNAG